MKSFKVVLMIILVSPLFLPTWSAEISKETLNSQLIEAIAINNVESVKNLLNQGADPNIKNKTGKTAVDYAKTDEIKQMLTAKMKDNKPNK